jgi:Xaa-Pro aminopeptidase
MTAPLLIHADTERSADLFHAIPFTIIDPFLYAEWEDRRAAVISVLDGDKVRDAGVEVFDPSAFGNDELYGQGLSRLDVDIEVSVRACRQLGIERAVVPPEFPVAYADALRAGGVELEIDAERFALRRRIKTSAQLEGIRRAQKAADAAMAEAASLIHALPGTLACEDVRAAMIDVCDEHGCDLPPDVIVSHGPQSAVGHESGFGVIDPGEPVVVDIWPRDRRSKCWADMTRTFVAGGGEPVSELRSYWELTRESLQTVTGMVRAGADCRAIYDASCEPFEAAGQPTQRTKEPGKPLTNGYYHGLGHGVGLEVHERPGLGRSPDTLLAGDVITLEPGCYRPGFGGVRLEDIVVVTETGCELLTDFPYEL